MKKVIFGLIMAISLSSCSALVGTIDGDKAYRCKSIKERKGEVSHKFQTNKKVFIFPKSHFNLKAEKQMYEVGDVIMFGN